MHDDDITHAVSTEATQPTGGGVETWYEHRGMRRPQDGTCWCGARVAPPQKVYCSKQCKDTFRKSRTKKIRATCIECGQEFAANFQRKTAGLGLYCSTKCCAAHFQKTGRLAGANSPRWIDGRSGGYSLKWPEKAAAHRAVRRAIRDGRLVSQPCETCGSTYRVHAHHDDYSKQLEVRWLCPQHHKDAHYGSDRPGRKPKKPKSDRKPGPKWLAVFRAHRAAQKAKP